MHTFRVGLVGLGCMGSAHYSVYKQMEKDGLPVKLSAICDVDEKKRAASEAVKGNLEVSGTTIDLAGLNIYADMLDMISREALDYVDLCLPTYLHSPMTVKALEAGVAVFCEKPMAINSAECTKMIDAARRTGKPLMIGHTLRYWDTYEYLKSIVDNETYGACVSAYFFRGGTTPLWSWENWLLNKEKSGGCLLDQHVHDVDTINWLFGMPEAVSSVGRVVYPGSGYDAVSTNYIYPNMAVNAQDDWNINGGGFGFDMRYRVNFERGAVVYEKGVTTSHPVGGEAFTPELSGESGYYKELRLFVDLLAGKADFNPKALLESHRDTIRLAEAEQASCDKKGAVVNL